MNFIVAGVAFLVMAVYGVGAISFSYLLSLVSQTPAGGFALVTILHIITGTKSCSKNLIKTTSFFKP